jgi:DNA-binding Lrp family transcriptional regulator
MYKLDEKDMKIVNYIADHPGCSKEDVVRMMKEENSRVTVLNRLRMLSKDGYIVSRKDRPNSQIYKLFVNADSLLVTETRDLEHFKKVFSEFLEILDKKREELETLWLKIRKERGYPYEYIVYNKPSDLIVYIYSHLIVIYTAKSIIEWPKTGDKEALKDLYERIFSQLFQIQSIVLNFYGRISNLQPSDIRVLPLTHILNNPFLLNPPRFDFFLDVFERFEIIDEVAPVIDSLWKITGSSFFSTGIKPYQREYPELENPEIFKDWKEFLRVWRIIKKKDWLHRVEMF